MFKAKIQFYLTENKNSHLQATIHKLCNLKNDISRYDEFVMRNLKLICYDLKGKKNMSILMFITALSKKLLFKSISIF